MTSHAKKHRTKPTSDRQSAFRQSGYSGEYSSYEGEYFDKAIHAALSQYWGWLSPAALALTTFDWLAHLSISPAKIGMTYRDIYEKYKLLNFHLFESSFHYDSQPCIECKIDDHRFQSESWATFPFNIYVQNFLLSEQFWDEITTNIRGVNNHHQNVINFMTRQMLDILSPSNFPSTNPEILSVTYQQGGSNFVRGFHNFIEDVSRYLNKLPPVGSEQFKVGENVAITPGKVIYRNSLIELIQYEPVTSKVYQEPILIIPAWIMKYYILDLSPYNSLVKYLTEKGHTVFIISWKNPGKEDRHLGLEDYVSLGIFSSVDVISNILPNRKINTVGYCIGGTLLMIAAAIMSSRSDDRLNSITLFAAQVDFKDAGELSLFIDESQVSYLEDVMWEKGYLEGNQMSQAFSMLRSSELIWSRYVHDYLLGERRPLNDLMAWDYDTTRLPYHMHSEYLRKLFLDNQIVQGKFSMFGKRVVLNDINVPIFCVSTIKDHIAPWRSVYKIFLFTRTDITFVLTTGGHNAGIVSEPNHPNRSYQLMTTLKGEKHISSESWFNRAPHYQGSWWPSWQEWLVSLSVGENSVPSMGSDTYFVICDAPGTYVLQK